MMMTTTTTTLGFFLLLFLILVSIFRPYVAAGGTHHQHDLPLPPPPSPTSVPQHQLNNIIDALMGAGDFKNWANLLSATDLFMFPLSATFFVPSDDALLPFPVHVPTSSTTTAFDPFMVPYYIVPERLTFSQLTFFKPLSRLPTLLPSKSILLTNTSLSNFTLDASQVSYPDLYLTSAIAVHGITALLNYTVYGGRSGGGDGGHRHVLSPPLPPPAMFVPLPGNGDKRICDTAAGCLSGEFAFILLLIPWVVVWVWATAIRIYANFLGL